MSLFRCGNEDAFRVIHDRYRPRMLAYTRQMLHGSRQDPEDAVQEIFVRAYGGLRATNRDLALRAWLYRIAHNRCIDELRRPRPTLCEEVDATTTLAHDPFVKVEQRDALRRLIADVQRLPEQQRSALLMRELAGMAYSDMSGALGVSVPAVKSLLVRARVGLAQASEARDTTCAEIRDDVIQAHDRGVRTSGLARRHMRDCSNCRKFRSEVRGVSRQFAALTPTLGPIGVIAHLLGSGGAGGGAAAGTGAAGGVGGGAAGAATSGAAGAAGGGAAASAGVLAGGTGHVVTLLAAAVVTAGSAVEIQRTLAPPAPHRSVQHHRAAPRSDPPARLTAVLPATAQAPPPAPPATATRPAAAGPAPDHHVSKVTAASSSPTSTSAGSSVAGSRQAKSLPLSETLDPDTMMYAPNNSGSSSTTSAAAGPGTGGTGAGATTGSAGATSGSVPAGTGTTGSGSTGSGSGTTARGTTGPGTAGTGTSGAAGTGTIGAAGTGTTGTAGTGTTGTAGTGTTGTAGTGTTGTAGTGITGTAGTGTTGTRTTGTVIVGTGTAGIGATGTATTGTGRTGARNRGGSGATTGRTGTGTAPRGTGRGHAGRASHHASGGQIGVFASGNSWSGAPAASATGRKVSSIETLHK